MTKRSVTHTTFVIERDLNASPARVFAAFSDPAVKALWFSGPADWRTPERSFDFRVGGHEVEVGGPVDGFTTALDAVYLDIVHDERIIYAYEMHLDGNKISDSLTTVELTAIGEKTHLKLTEQGAYLDGWDNPDDRERGTNGAIDLLAAVVEKQ